jgi:hypothetical protein
VISEQFIFQGNISFLVLVFPNFLETEEVGRERESEGERKGWREGGTKREGEREREKREEDILQNRLCGCSICSKEREEERKREVVQGNKS